MLKSKKLCSLLLTAALCVCMAGVSYAFNPADYQIPGYTFENYTTIGGYDFDEHDVPADLPEGTIKIGHGLYLYTPEVETMQWYDNVSVGTVGPIGTITNPGALSSIQMESGDKYIWCTSSSPVKINFTSGTTSIFGSEYTSWPNVGSSWLVVDIAACGMNVNTTYRMQLTGVSSSTHSNVVMSVRSNSYRPS